MILLLAAVPLETTLLRDAMSNRTRLPCSRYESLSGQLCGQEIILAHSGIGQTGMARQLTFLLTRYSPEAVVLCGCGGGYPNSGLRVGDLALASEEYFGDVGVLTPEGFRELEQLAIPQEEEYAPRFRQTLPLDSKLREWAGNILGQPRCGRFVTVNCCSGTPESSRELEQRTGGVCENMEGAAAAMVCADFSVPMLELRGISNPTGTRDPADWDIMRGVQTAQEAVIKLLEQPFDFPRSTPCST